MGKQRIIAETGAGQHGVATAAACARVGLPCEVFMGAEDVRRQAPNVERMKLLGAVVRPVESGSRTLKDAMNEAIRDWVTNVRTTFYVIGSVAGPHPYPSMVRDLQAVIGDEARRQCLERWGALPDAVVACVGGGSNAMGIFSAFLGDAAVRLVAVEAGGEGLASGRHGASLTAGRFGVLHGSASSVLQTDDGQVQEAHSISAGLDYPGRRSGAGAAPRRGAARRPHRDRRRGAGRPACILPAGGHPPRAGDGARAGPDPRGGAGARPRAAGAGQPLRPRGQGSGARAGELARRGQGPGR